MYAMHQKFDWEPNHGKTRRESGGFGCSFGVLHLPFRPDPRTAPNSAYVPSLLWWLRLEPWRAAAESEVERLEIPHQPLWGFRIEV